MYSRTVTPRASATTRMRSSPLAFKRMDRVAGFLDTGFSSDCGRRQPLRCGGDGSCPGCRRRRIALQLRKRGLLHSFFWVLRLASLALWRTAPGTGTPRVPLPVQLRKEPVAGLVRARCSAVPLRETHRREAQLAAWKYRFSDAQNARLTLFSSGVDMTDYQHPNQHHGLMGVDCQNDLHPGFRTISRQGSGIPSHASQPLEITAKSLSSNENRCDVQSITKHHSKPHTFLSA